MPQPGAVILIMQPQGCKSSRSNTALQSLHKSGEQSNPIPLHTSILGSPRSSCLLSFRPWQPVVLPTTQAQLKHLYPILAGSSKSPHRLKLVLERELASSSRRQPCYGQNWRHFDSHSTVEHFCFHCNSWMCVMGLRRAPALCLLKSPMDTFLCSPTHEQAEVSGYCLTACCSSAGCSRAKGDGWSPSPLSGPSAPWEGSPSALPQPSLGDSAS